MSALHVIHLLTIMDLNNKLFSSTSLNTGPFLLMINSILVHSTYSLQLTGQQNNRNTWTSPLYYYNISSSLSHQKLSTILSCD